MVRWHMAEVDILIKNANEVIVLKDNGRPRRGKEMRELDIIKGGYVAIKDGRIFDVGKSCKMKGDVEIDARNKIVLPGFVDCHTHLAFSCYRDFELEMKLRGLSYQEIAAAGGGINYTVKLTRAASKDELKRSSMERLNRMLEYGTTTCEAKSGYGLDLKSEIKLLEVYRELNAEHPIDIIPTFLGAHSIPEEFKENAEGYVERIVGEMIPEVSDRGLARFCDVFCERGYFNLEQSRKILLTGKEYGLTPKIHADEFSDCGGASLAAEIGAISADHLLRISGKGIHDLKNSKTIAVLLPATVFSMMKKDFAPARKLIDNNIPVALATDMNPNCYTENMQFVIQLACYYMNMLPEEAIAGATINAAYAVGEAHRVGSLDKGKSADVIIMNCPSYRFIPYHFGVNLVDTTIKDGRIVYSSSISSDNT